MEQQSTAIGITRQQLQEFIEILKNPRESLNLKIFHLSETKEFLERSQSFILKSFLDNYPEINSIKDFYIIIEKDNSLWKLLNEDEKDKIIDILRLNRLIEEDKTLRILNAIAIHFLYNEFCKLIINDDFIKAKKVFKFLSAYKAQINKFKKALIEFNPLIKRIGIKYGKYAEIDKLPEEVFDIYQYLKNPAKRLILPTPNFLIAIIVDTAQSAKIKNHYSDFTIPVIKELKKGFPDQFKEITSLDKVYLMNRARIGRLYIPKSDIS